MYGIVDGLEKSPKSFLTTFQNKRQQQQQQQKRRKKNIFLLYHLPVQTTTTTNKQTKPRENCLTSLPLPTLPLKKYLVIILTIFEGMHIFSQVTSFSLKIYITNFELGGLLT